MKCRECKCLESQMPSNGGIRCKFYCGHKNQKYIYEYFKTHRISKMPAFLCFGGGLYGVEPTIKTSPAWCPLKKKYKEETTK